MSQESEQGRGGGVRVLELRVVAEPVEPLEPGAGDLVGERPGDVGHGHRVAGSPENQYPWKR